MSAGAFEVLKDYLFNSTITNVQKRGAIGLYLKENECGSATLLYLKKSWVGCYGTIATWKKMEAAYLHTVQTKMKVKEVAKLKKEVAAMVDEQAAKAAEKYLHGAEPPGGSNASDQLKAFQVAIGKSLGVPSQEMSPYLEKELLKHTNMNEATQNNLAAVMDDIHYMLASLHEAGLNEKAIITLLADSSGIAKGVIKKVLKAMMELKKNYGVVKSETLYLSTLKGVPTAPPLMDKGDEHPNLHQFIIPGDDSDDVPF